MNDWSFPQPSPPTEDGVSLIHVVDLWLIFIFLSFCWLFVMHLLFLLYVGTLMLFQFLGDLNFALSFSVYRNFKCSSFRENIRIISWGVLSLPLLVNSHGLKLVPVLSFQMEEREYIWNLFWVSRTIWPELYWTLSQNSRSVLVRVHVLSVGFCSLRRVLTFFYYLSSDFSLWMLHRFWSLALFWNFMPLPTGELAGSPISMNIMQLA